MSRLDGRTKLVCLFASTGIYLADEVWLVALLLAQGLVLLVASGAHQTGAFRALWRLLPLIVALTALGLFIGGVDWITATLALARLIAVILSVVAVFAVLQPFEVVAGLYGFGLPAGPAVSLSVGLRFVPILVDDIHRIFLARKARGLEGRRHKLGLVRYLLAPVLFLSLERADRMLFSLQIRGATLSHLLARSRRFTGLDWGVVVLAVLEVGLCASY